MKKADVNVGTVYSAKVSGNVVPVRIDRENPRGGWDGTNLKTKKAIRIKSAQRLRGKAATWPGKADEAPAAEVAETVETGGKKDGKKAAKGRTPKGPRHSLANAAILVLADAEGPLNAKAIVEKAMADGLYAPGDGKTPEATLYSAMLRDKKARFAKAERGLWTLTDAGKAEVEAIRQAFATK